MRNGGSLISKLAVPGGSDDYEVNSILTLTANGGTYVQYLRASNDALSGPATTGTFYAVELQNPNVATATATLAIYKRVGGIVTSLGSSTVSFQNGMPLRSIIRGQQIIVYSNGYHQFNITDASIISGKPGVGARGTPAGNSISRVDLGPLDVIAPFPVNSQSIGTSVQPNAVDFQWENALDDANGIGRVYYEVRRNGSFLAKSQEPVVTDATVSPSTSYAYSITAVDYHGNASTPANINITTPPTGSIDPRHIGLRPTGSYWGAAVEQIDMLSGNLNFTIPLLKAQGRGGWSVPFSLIYNSQLWRQDPGGTWNLGRDVGYGFGWKLQAGSLTPYYSGYYTVHHWVFTDSTGAEYRLDVNTNGVWTSKESINVAYDSNQWKLYFPDGSFWLMNIISMGEEQDSGNRYPSVMQDSNGNQVLIRYGGGKGAPWAEGTSARIKEIEDVRAVLPQGATTYRTYLFTYDTDPDFPHLLQVYNYLQTGAKLYLRHHGRSKFVLAVHPTADIRFNQAALEGQLYQPA